MTIGSNRKKLVNFLLGSENKEVEISFEVAGRTFVATSPDDQYWGSIKDVLLDREYECFPEFELNKFKGLVVDAGAHVGLFSLVSSVWARKIVALEPHSINYRILKANFQKNKIKNAVALNKVLCGQKSQEVKLYQGIDSGCNSMLRGSNIDYETVLGTTVDEIVEEHGDIDLLKMDIEGAEFEVFKSLGKETMTRINALVAEIHLEVGKPAMIFEKLKDAGFKVRALHPPIVKKGGEFSIRVHQLNRPKLLKALLHSDLSLRISRDKNFLILFAVRA